MRSKEDAHDYRYFPEPDLPPVRVEEAFVEEQRRRLPELPQARERRYQRELSLPAADAALLTAEREVSEFFEAAVDAVLARSAAEVERYRAGNKKLMGFFVGQVMKATGGKANPAVVNELLKKKL